MNLDTLKLMLLHREQAKLITFYQTFPHLPSSSGRSFKTNILSQISPMNLTLVLPVSLRNVWTGLQNLELQLSLLQSHKVFSHIISNRFMSHHLSKRRCYLGRNLKTTVQYQYRGQAFQCLSYMMLLKVLFLGPYFLYYIAHH